MNCWLCGVPVFGADVHPCCQRWWDGTRCIGCHASGAAGRGDIWRSHQRIEQAGNVRTNPVRPVNPGANPL